MKTVGVDDVVDLGCAVLECLLLLLSRWIPASVDFTVLDDDHGRVNLIDDIIYILAVE